MAAIEIDLDRLGLGEGQTFGEAVVEAAARQLVAGLEHSVRMDVERRAHTLADEELRVRIAPLVEKALSEGFQLTSVYGEPRGEKTTMREYIVMVVRKWLNEPDPDARFNDTPKLTRVAAMIRKEVDAVVRRDLLQALEAARAQVVAGVKDKAAEVIAETIAKTVVR